MEDAFALLGLQDSAGIEEIEEAWRHKKELCAPDSFVEGSLEYEFARTRSDALDKAYAEAVAFVFAPRRVNVAAVRGIPLFSSSSGDLGVSPFGDMMILLLVMPVIACLMQFVTPAVLFDLIPGGAQVSSLVPVAIIMLLSYLFPLFLRTVFPGRRFKGFAATLALFPLTMLTTDFFASALLHFFFWLPGHKLRYFPVFYVMGLGPLFLMISAHCVILRMPRFGVWKAVPFFRRLTSQTLSLFLAATFSILVCVACNGEKEIAAAKMPASPVPGGGSEASWQDLELLDAGVIGIPGAWYVEDSNARPVRMDHGQSVQYIREALLARPYRRKEGIPDFAFEVLVYTWTERGGKILPPPEDAPERIQENQAEALKKEYTDIVAETTVGERGGRYVSAMTAETRAFFGHTVRFKNLIFKQSNRLYCLTVGYPAEDEQAWGALLNDILERWRLQ